MARDLVIKGGTIVDGTGAERFTRDVAVDDGVFTVVARVQTRANDTDTGERPGRLVRNSS